MNRLKNYRKEGGTEITLSNGSKDMLLVVRHNPNRNIIVAVLKENKRVILWEGDDVDSHLRDSKTKFVTKIKSVLG